MQTFFDCIKNSVRHEGIRSGLLPLNCFHIKISDDGTRDFCLWHPYLRADISYFGTEYPDFPLPRLVFGFQVSPEGKVKGVAGWALSRTKYPMKIPPCTYILFRTWAASICVPGITISRFTKRPAPSGIFQPICCSCKQQRQFQRNQQQTAYALPELLNHLRDKDPAYYYTDVLIPNGKTLKEFIG